MKRILIALLLAVLTLLAATGIGLGVIHLTDFPYVADIDALEISEYSGLDHAEIMANYKAVMVFLTPFSSSDFDLPTLNFSETGARHFVDCRNVFNGVYLAAFISLLTLAVVFAMKKLEKRTIVYSGIFTLSIPILLGIAMATNFDRAFLLFHAVFFEGETWIFDPAVDEIIRILPSEFFMHCALLIAGFWLIAAATEILFGMCKTKTSGISSKDK
jgi:integral membrane protein TIGR01906